MNHAGRAALFLTTAMLLLSPAAIPAIYDGDDRRSIVDNDDPRIDALSDAVGAASVCNRTLSAVLTKREDDPADYVVLPAHSFFDRRGKPVLGKDGKPCTIEELAQAEYYPNLKYLYLGADRDFAMRALPVAWPPINLETGREWGTRGEDVLIFRIDRPAQGYLSDDIMPSGRKRGHLRYFLYDPKAVEMSRFGRLARISFVRDSPRPLEQLFQTTGIVARSADSMVYDTSDAWFMASGSPLLGELDGETAILGHAATGPGKDGEPQVEIDTSTEDFDRDMRNWNRNIPGTMFAGKYGLAAIPVE